MKNPTFYFLIFQPIKTQLCNSNRIANLLSRLPAIWSSTVCRLYSWPSSGYFYPLRLYEMECIKNTQACKFWPCQARRGDNVGLCVLVMQWYLVVKVAYFMRWYEYQAGQPKLNGSRIFITSQILWNFVKCWITVVCILVQMKSFRRFWRNLP